MIFPKALNILIRECAKTRHVHVVLDVQKFDANSKRVCENAADEIVVALPFSIGKTANGVHDALRETLFRKSFRSPVAVFHHVMEQCHDPLVVRLGAGHEAEWVQDVCRVCLVHLMFVGDGGDAGGFADQ